MGDTSALLKEPEYEVHASKNPQDHFVQQKSVQTRLAEDKGYQAKKLNDAILKTAGQALQSFGSLKTQLDKDTIKIQNHDATMSSLKNEREYHQYKATNQEEWNNFSPVEREDKLKEFFQPTYSLVEGMHEDVRNHFAVAHEKALQNERLAMIDKDALRWYTGKVNSVIETLQAFPTTGENAVSQEDFNESANNAILSVQGITGVELKVVNAEIRKIAIDALKKDDARLYNFANSLNMYGTGEAYDDGTSTKAATAFEDYGKRNITESLKSANSQLSNIFTDNINSAESLSRAVSQHETDLNLQDGEAFKDVIKIVANQIAVRNLDNLDVLMATTDSQGRPLISDPLYAAEVNQLLTQKRLHDNNLNKTNLKQVKAIIRQNIVRSHIDGTNLIAFDGKDFNDNDPLNPVFFRDIKQAVHNDIRQHDDQTLESLIDNPEEWQAYHRSMMQRYQANGITNEKWSQLMKNASAVIDNGDFTNPFSLDQIEKAVNLYQELDTFSPSYVNDNDRASFDAIIAYQELSRSTLADAVSLTQNKIVDTTEVKWPEVSSKLADTSGFNNLDDADDFTVRELNAALNHTKALMKKGISQENAIKMVKERYLDVHYTRIKLNGSDRLIDNRGFKTEMPSYDQYADYLGDYLEEIEEEMNQFKDDNLKYTLKRIPNSNNYVFENEEGVQDYGVELSNGSFIPTVITPEIFKEWAGNRIASIVGNIQPTVQAPVEQPTDTKQQYSKDNHYAHVLGFATPLIKDYNRLVATMKKDAFYSNAGSSAAINSRREKSLEETKNKIELIMSGNRKFMKQTLNNYIPSNTDDIYTQWLATQQ